MGAGTLKNLFVIGLAMASLAGCSRPPGRYDLPVDQVYARLADNELKEFKLSQQCGLLVYIQPSGVPNRSVTWTVTTSNVEVAKFRVALTPVSSSETQVDLTINRLPSGHEPFDGTQVEPRPAFQQPLRPAIEEAIASAIEQRPFDPARFDQHINEISAQDSPELNKQKTALYNVNSVCMVQRGSLESGGGAFSIKDSPSSYGK